MTTFYNDTDENTINVPEGDTSHLAAPPGPQDINIYKYYLIYQFIVPVSLIY